MHSVVNNLTLILILATGALTAPVLAELSVEEQAMIAWIDEHAEDSVDLLEELVNIGSGTMNAQGIHAVGELLRTELDGLGLDTEWIEQPAELNRGNHLVGRLDGTRGKKMLLIGHLDTVFEATDDFQAFSREDNIGRGPGIEDMKSGDVVIV